MKTELILAGNALSVTAALRTPKNYLQSGEACNSKDENGMPIFTPRWEYTRTADWPTALEDLGVHQVYGPRYLLEVNPYYRQYLPYCMVVSEMEVERVTKEMVTRDVEHTEHVLDTSEGAEEGATVETKIIVPETKEEDVVHKVTVPTLLVYRRTKKIGEERLGGMYSVGFGGHIEVDDYNDSKDGANLATTVETNLVRELSEELLNAYTAEPFFSVQDSINGVWEGKLSEHMERPELKAVLASHWMDATGNDVARYHLALIHAAKAKENFDASKLALESELTLVGMRPVMDGNIMLEDGSAVDTEIMESLEDWSLFCVRYFADLTS